MLWHCSVSPKQNHVFIPYGGKVLSDMNYGHSNYLQHCSPSQRNPLPGDRLCLHSENELLRKILKLTRQICEVLYVIFFPHCWRKGIIWSYMCI